MMKNTVLAIASLVSFGVYAQEENPVAKPTSCDPVFMCKTMKIDNDSKTITLIEDASYKDAIIEIRGASEIIFDQGTNEIIVTGPYDFTIDGAVQFESGEGPKKLKYKVGETVAYIN